MEKIKMTNENLISNLKKKISKNLRVEPVFKGADSEKKLDRYLLNQTYLEYSKLKKIISINFLKEKPIGYIILNNDKNIVGFLGTIFSYRNINQKNYLFCNLHTWIVDEKYRIHSYILLLPILEEQNVLTTFTPINTLLGLYQKLGFQKIEMKYRINLSLSFFKNEEFELSDDYNFYKKFLDEKCLKLYNDHLNFSCHKFFIYQKDNKNKNIFVISKKNKRKFFMVLDLIYISDLNYLKENWIKIAPIIYSKYKILFCGHKFINENECVLPKKLIFSKEVSSNICMKNLPNDYQFDTLYSEFI